MLIFGKFDMFFFAMLTVLLHEMGHSFVGRKLGYKLDLITLLPYGAMLSGKNTPFSTKDEIIIALAGPILNAILIIINLLLWWIFPNISLNNYFFYSNVYTLIFNLLPVYPLDGGRIFVAILSTKMPRIRAEQKTKLIGYLITAVFFLIFFVSFFFELNYMLGINALFMLIGLFGEDTAPYYEKVSSFDKFGIIKRNARIIKLDKSEPIFLAYKYVTEKNAKQIYVCENGKAIKKLSKNDVLSSVLTLPIDATLEKTIV